MIYALSYVLILAAVWLAYRWGYERGQLEETTIRLINRVDLDLLEQIIADQGWTIYKPETNEPAQEGKKWPH